MKARLALILIVIVAAAAGCDPTAAGPSFARAKLPKGTATTTTTAPAPAATSELACTTYSEAGEDAQTFIDRLGPGAIGCLRHGVYTDSLSIKSGGITLTEVPGEQATICGRLAVMDSANDVTIANLSFDGSCSTENTVKIYGDRVRVVGNDITNRYKSKSCMMVGSASAGAAVDAVIERNHIHECGSLSGEGLDHGIYMAATRGAVVRNNVIWGADAYGIQVYPDAQQSTITNNVIDGSRSRSAMVIGGDYEGRASSGTYVAHNIFSWNDDYGVKGYWPSAVGSGNVVEHNCIWANTAGVYLGGGFTRGDYVAADPRFVDRAGHNYALRADSPCVGMGPTA